MQEREIFIEALTKKAAERPAYLATACGQDHELRRRVERLLSEHEKEGSFFLDAPLAVLDATIGLELPEKSGVQIGPYKLLQQIGEGGMGVVFMAEQTAPVRRKVAVKVIKPGMDTRQVIARFEAERQALAVMDHPNIARVLDAGGTESGRPYFVMELVRGVPITVYCDEHNLPIRERLELFTSVCQAIQHAHTKAIIHRDIKPTNVLITRQDGAPIVKVIDFGVAKAMGQQLTEKTLFTEFSQMVGTPLYMSPEQAELSSVDIDTRSDVYSLGVLLYELLTGSTPVNKEEMKKAAYDEIRRIIREEQPQRPSTRISGSNTLASIAAQRHIDPARLSKLVRGELDWIVMRALEKDRSRRYETASSFAADVDRYLNGEAVHACPPSAIYRFRKFAQRNKAALLTASAMLVTLLMLVIGLGLSNIWIIAERNQKTQALKEKGVALIAARESAAEAKAESLRSRKNFLAARIAIREVITKAALGDGEWAQLPTSLRRRFSQEAIKFYQELLQSSSDPSERYETAIAYRSIALLHARPGTGVQHSDQAEHFYRQSISMLEELAQAFPGDVEYRYHLADSYRMFGAFLTRERQLAEAAMSYRSAAALLQQLLIEVPHSADYAKGFANCLVALQNLSGEKEAVGYLQSLETAISHAALEPAEKLRLGQVYAQLLSEVGRHQQAEELQIKVASGYEKLAAESSAVPEYRYLQAISHLRAGQLLARSGRLVEAEQNYQKSIIVLQKLAEEFPDEVKHRAEQGRSINWLGVMLTSAGRHEEAESQHRDAMRIYSELIQVAHPQSVHWHRRELAWSRMHLGDTLARTQRMPEAESEFRSAQALCEMLAVEHPDDMTYPTWISDISERLRNLYVTTSRLHEAEQETRRVIELLEPYVDMKLRLALANHYNELAFLLKSAERPQDAEAAVRKAIQVKQQLATDSDDNRVYRLHLAHSHLGLGYLLRDGGRPSEAAQAFAEAATIFQKLTAEMPQDANYQNDLARAFAFMGLALEEDKRGAEAEEAFGKALVLWTRLSDEHPAHEWYRRERAYFSLSLVRLLESTDRPQEALEHVRMSVRLHEQLLVEFPAGKAEYEPRLANGRSILISLLSSLGHHDEAATEAAAVVRANPSAEQLNDIAWNLVGRAKGSAESARLATELATKAVELSSGAGHVWNTLGVAQYRAGNWQEAITALDKSRELRNGGDSFDWFFLAMAHWQLDQKDESNKWYSQAVEWMEENSPDNAELLRFRAEADELRGATKSQEQSTSHARDACLRHYFEEFSARLRRKRRTI